MTPSETEEKGPEPDPDEAYEAGVLIGRDSGDAVSFLPWADMTPPEVAAWHKGLAEGRRRYLAGQQAEAGCGVHHQGKVPVWLSPKAARFAATACDRMADAELDDANDNPYYRAIARAIRAALP